MNKNVLTFMEMQDGREEDGDAEEEEDEEDADALDAEDEEEEGEQGEKDAAGDD